MKSYFQNRKNFEKSGEPLSNVGHDKNENSI